jgi:hypothetical protein
VRLRPRPIDLVEALSKIPALCRVECHVYKQWSDNPPESLVYATLGKALADRFADLDAAHRTYAMAVIKVALNPQHPRAALVRQALIGTLAARMRHMDKKRAALLGAFLKGLTNVPA